MAYENFEMISKISDLITDSVRKHAMDEYKKVFNREVAEDELLNFIENVDYMIDSLLERLDVEITDTLNDVDIDIEESKLAEEFDEIDDDINDIADEIDDDTIFGISVETKKEDESELDWDEA